MSGVLEYLDVEEGDVIHHVPVVERRAAQDLEDLEPDVSDENVDGIIDDFFSVTERARLDAQIQEFIDNLNFDVDPAQPENLDEEEPEIQVVDPWDFVSHGYEDLHPDEFHDQMGFASAAELSEEAYLNEDGILDAHPPSAQSLPLSEVERLFAHHELPAGWSLVAIEPEDLEDLE